MEACSMPGQTCYACAYMLQRVVSGWHKASSKRAWLMLVGQFNVGQFP